MTIDASDTLSPVLWAVAVCVLAGAVPVAKVSAEARLNPAGGGDSVVLEPVSDPPPVRTRRAVFVCRDGASVVFADRPCGQVVETRALEVAAAGPGQVASTAHKPPVAAVLPRVDADRSAREPPPGDGRCRQLRSRLEALDDRMRTGYPAREAARLWNRWREIKAQLHEARC